MYDQQSDFEVPNPHISLKQNKFKLFLQSNVGPWNNRRKQITERMSKQPQIKQQTRMKRIRTEPKKIEVKNRETRRKTQMSPQKIKIKQQYTEPILQKNFLPEIQSPNKRLLNKSLMIKQVIEQKYQRNHWQPQAPIYINRYITEASNYLKMYKESERPIIKRVDRFNQLNFIHLSRKKSAQKALENLLKYRRSVKIKPIQIHV